MMLVVSSQDIGSISLALAQGQTLVQSEDFLVPPEGHLKSLDTALSDWGIASDQIESVLVVTGPGSFTASRVSTTIANAIGFVKDIPVYGIENPEKQSLAELVADFDPGVAQQMGVVDATYDRPPTITKPKQA
jgi:tRNA A37 threonylcarbamoyladenosine modification protein TsaB